MKRTKVRLQYIITDFLMANIAWMLFNITRYEVARIHYSFVGLDQYLLHPRIVMGQIIFPILMMGVFWLSGYYNVVIRKSRIDELVSTFLATATIALTLFFSVVLNDFPDNHTVSLFYLSSLFIYLFSCIYLPRLLFTKHISYRVHNRSLTFRTLIVGTETEAESTTRKLASMKKSLGYEIIGAVTLPGEKASKLTNIPILGSINDIEQIIHQHAIESVITATNSSDKKTYLERIAPLFFLQIPVYTIAERYDLLTGTVREHVIYSTVPLIRLNGERISAFEHNLKALVSWILSFITFILLIPIYLIIALLVRIDSKGPILYQQERLGYRNKPFTMYKFRSMRCDAENDTPLLSSPCDKRVTPLGRILRKYRLDELPQFWNVLIGDMALVGPRPERAYFAQQIIEKDPYYILLQRVKPGVTSWGMVKYGYASNIDEMLERLEYDLLYVENNSFMIDLRILIYTFIIICKGRGL